MRSLSVRRLIRTSRYRSLLVAIAHAPRGSGTLGPKDPRFFDHGGCGTVILALFPPSNKVKNNRYPQTRVNWPKKAIFRPNSLKTRLQGQSSVSIAPRLGRVTLRETLRYPTPCPFGVSTEADSLTSPLPGRSASSC